MRCYICDRLLGEKEISLDEHTLQTEPCGVCLEIIYEAAYPAGFDPVDDEYVLIEEEQEPDLSGFFGYFDPRKDLD